MIFIIDEQFKKNFTDQEHLFDQLMQVDGKVFRHHKNRCTLRFEQAGQAYFIKKHRATGWREIFKNLFQGRLPVVGAKNEYVANQQLKKIGLPTIDIVAFAERGFNPASKRSFLVSKELTGCDSLEDLVGTWSSRFSEKKQLIKEVARVTRLMHEHGINHRDYYLCHLWWRREVSQLYVMDLHRAQIRKKVPVRWLIKDLAGLYFSSMDAKLTVRDIYQFLKIYFNEPLGDIFKKRSRLLKAVSNRALKLYHKEA